MPTPFRPLKLAAIGVIAASFLWTGSARGSEAYAACAECGGGPEACPHEPAKSPPSEPSQPSTPSEPTPSEPPKGEEKPKDDGGAKVPQPPQIPKGPTYTPPEGGDTKGDKGGVYYPKVDVPVVSTPICYCGGEGCKCEKAFACGGADIVGATPEGFKDAKKVCMGPKICPCHGEGCKCKTAMACGGAMSIMYADPKTGQTLEKWVCQAPKGKECQCGGEGCSCEKDNACGGKKSCSVSGCKAKGCSCAEICPKGGGDFACKGMKKFCSSAGCGLKGCICGEICPASKESELPCQGGKYECSKDGCRGAKCTCSSICGKAKTLSFECGKRSKRCPCGCSSCKPMCAFGTP